MSSKLKFINCIQDESGILLCCLESVVEVAKDASKINDDDSLMSNTLLNIAYSLEDQFHDRKKQMDLHPEQFKYYPEILIPLDGILNDLLNKGLVAEKESVIRKACVYLYNMLVQLKNGQEPITHSN